MTMPTNYNWLVDLLMRSGGEAMDALDPSRVSQRGRAQLASNNRWNRAHEDAQKYNADKEMALRERANEEARSAYNAAQGVAPMALAGPQGQPSQAPSPQAPRASLPEIPWWGDAPQRPYPGQGAPVRPPQQAAPQQAPRPQAPQVAAPTARPQISPQDYYAMLQSGMFRMG
jgi:hypothetical protein